MNILDILRKNMNINDGVITFREYMQTVLYHPGLGYYSSPRDKISSCGDFITATSQTSIFASTFARQFAQILPKLSSDSYIIEFGAGTGKFASDCMLELEKCNVLPAKYIIIELSADLKSKQQSHILSTIPKLYGMFEWLSELPKDKLNAVVFANEVLDAMPIDIFKSTGGAIIQQGVRPSGDTFELVDMLSDDARFELESQKISDDGVIFEDGYMSELNTWIRPWVKSIKECLHSGVVFLCDYGYDRKTYYSEDRAMGTLACYSNHAVSYDPFECIGEKDITAHVDFTAVAESIVENGFELDGYITQANFLKRADIANVFLDITKNMSSDLRLKYNADMKQLVLNDKLAEVFKVMSFSTGFEDVLNVFDNDDNIDYLL